MEFVHDGLGRRTRLITADGSWTEYAWGLTGHLTGTCERTPDGEVMSRHALWVDGLGELAGIDGSRLWWDTANPIPTLTGITPSSDSTADAGTMVIAGRQVLSLPGGVTGIGDAWMASGWRAARPTDETDPWAVLGAATISDPAPGGSTDGMTGAGPAGLVVGADVVIQKATTGEVNWGQAAVSGGLGMVGGGVGMAAGKFVSNPVVRMAVENGVEGASSGASGYLTGPGPHTPTGFFRATALGGGTGALPIGGPASRVDLPPSATAKLGDLPPTLEGMRGNPAANFTDGAYTSKCLREETILYRGEKLEHRGVAGGPRTRREVSIK